MSALTWFAHHRLLAFGVGLTVLLVGVAVGVWFFVLRSPAAPVDLRQALKLYRQDQRGGHGGGADLPPAGVYGYRTSGGERLSFAGISRSFPATTDMIVTESRCATLEWEPLEQHMEGLVECPQPDGALTIRAALSYEQIAGTQNTGVIRCPAGTYLVPPDPRVGTRWQTTCHSTGERVVFTGQVVGRPEVDVGGQKVPALHTRLDLSFSGSERGLNPNDYWVSPQDGLILEQRETVDLVQKAGPLGSVRYSEQMAIRLNSVTPVR